MEPARMPKRLSSFFDGRHIRKAVGQVPEHVQGERGGDAGEAVDLGGVGEFFLDGGSGGGLHKLAEARAGVGESPGGNLDLKGVQSLCCQIVRLRIRIAS